jgi:thioredoxin 1
MKATIEINEANFETEVLKSSQPVLVEFATGWSLPSMMTNGAMDEIATEFVDCLKVGRVKLDSTGWLDFKTSASKFASLISIVDCIFILLSIF